MSTRYTEPSRTSLRSGLLYIASYLRENGHSVNFADADNLGLDHQDILGVVRKNGSTVVGIACMTTQIRQVYELSTFLKAAVPGIVIIVGGPHASALPDEGPGRVQRYRYRDHRGG